MVEAGPSIQCSHLMGFVWPGDQKSKETCPGSSISMALFCTDCGSGKRYHVLLLQFLPGIDLAKDCE